MPNLRTRVFKITFVVVALGTSLQSCDCMQYASGRVVDAGTGLPLEGAYVYKERQPATKIITDTSGKYTFSSTSRGLFKCKPIPIIIEKEGYKRAQTKTVFARSSVEEIKLVDINHTKVTNAPSYIRKRVKLVEGSTLNKIRAEYGPFCNAFSLKEMVYSLQGSYNEEYQEFDGSIYSGEKSGNKNELFNCTKHGYDGLYNNFPETKLSTILQEYQLNKSNTKHQIVLAFQYSGEEAGFVEENGHKPEDYFGWIVIYELSGSQLIKLDEYECM